MGNIFGRFDKFEKELPNVDGKVFVITGTTSGTGYIAAETVAKHGGEVLLLNRASPRSVASYQKLKKENTGGGTFVPIDCDLQDFQSVKGACAKIKSLGYTNIYCLSNNAGIMAVDDTITKSDGYEVQMQTNHLSHFLLTSKLFPLLVEGSKKYGDARIVQHSSASRLSTDFPWQSFLKAYFPLFNLRPNRNKHNRLEEKYFTIQTMNGQLGGNELTGLVKGGPWYRYHQTKLANSVFNHALHDKLQASTNTDVRNIIATCAHPGASTTNLADHLNAKSNFLMRNILIPVLLCVFAQSSKDGSMGLLRGMMDAKANIQSGILYGPKLKLPNSQSTSGYAIPNPPTPCEIDAQSKEMLWNVSEKAIGQKFSIP